MKISPRAVGALALLAVSATAAPAQAPARRPLDHEAYGRFRRVAGEVLSPDGGWLAYGVVPGDGDGALLVHDLRSGQSVTFERGAEPRFSDDSRYLVFRVKPAEDSLAAARRARRKDRKVRLPTDTLAWVSLSPLGGGEGAEATRVGRLASFQVAEEGAPVLAYLLENDTAQGAQDVEAEPRAGGGERPDEAGSKEEGKPLVLVDLASGREQRFEGVSEYALSRDGRHLWFLTSSGDPSQPAGAYRVVTSDGSRAALLTGEGKYVKLALDREGTSAAFLVGTEAEGEESEGEDKDGGAPSSFSLHLAGAAAGGGSRVLAAEGAPGIPAAWTVAEGGSVRFSRDGSRVFFGTTPRAARDGDEEEPEVDEDEAVVLDVWNWQDPYLQPMQLVQAEREKQRSWMAVAAVSDGQVVQLETEDVPQATVSREGNGDVALGTSDLPYRQLVSWDGRYADVYLVDVRDGSRELVLESLRGRAELSPDGRWVTWWDGEARTWYAMDTATRDVVDLAEGIPHPVHDDSDDHPDTPPPFGLAGFTEEERWALLYDEHDIWAVDPAGERAPRSVTEGVGRRNGLRFRYVTLDREEPHVTVEGDLLLAAFEPATKRAGFYRDRFEGSAEPRPLVFEDASFSRPVRAEDADLLLFTRETFQEFPDLWVGATDLSDRRKVSDANPQHSEYLWGTAELVHWRSADGIPLQGILYKPEGFDPSRKYPMMVYFYERSSDGLHGYHLPAPGSSSINRSFYVSRGYVVFVPDIPYEVGHPGESALDAVVPGVLHLVAQGFVDPERVGVQGHSWGGYQIAYMVTRTNLFAAAEAGAPVVNMTSAYGGIRWSTGMSRMFQYEKTQSRIGGTLWDAQHLFIQNSPLFNVDKIRTPVLMMHNDEDGAVPWYQGIEMFVAMRRLAKPVWLLNYNGEDHGLRKDANRKDFAIRMQQFFDHYLQGAPPPVWMVEGIPAVAKGETLGLDLVETAPVAAESATGERRGGGGRR